jgi:hypothetical protein
MDPEGSLPRIKNPATCHYSEHCCVTSAKNGGFSVLTSVRPFVIVYDIEPQMLKNISEYRAAAMYIKLRELTTVQYVITTVKYVIMTVQYVTIEKQ